MARRKRIPQAARQSPGRRLVELGKDLLIAALTCSAVFLASRSPIATQLRDLVSPAQGQTEPQTRRAGESVTPYGVAVRNSRGLYGVNYDPEQVDRVFEQLSPLVGEALATAGPAEKITQTQWRRLLEAPGFYCVFQGSPPLSALSVWLGEGGELSGSARDLTLSWDGERVWLGWRDGEDRFRAATDVAYDGRLGAVVEEFSPNGAAFAYTLAGRDAVYAALDPYVLVTMTSQRPATYTASSPDFAGDQDALEQLLKALGFRSGVGSAYEAAGYLAINESGDRLRVNASGQVIFHAGEEGRYPVVSAGEEPTAQEAALAAWEVLDRAAEPWKGECTYVLTGAEETAGGWTVTFQARLNGIPVLTSPDGWCARFVVAGGEISGFTLRLRTYAATGASQAVMGERLAAAALKAQGGSGGRLTLCYSDNRSGALAAAWVAEE